MCFPFILSSFTLFSFLPPQTSCISNCFLPLPRCFRVEFTKDFIILFCLFWLVSPHLRVSSGVFFQFLFMCGNPNFCWRTLLPSLSYLHAVISRCKKRVRRDWREESALWLANIIPLENFFQSSSRDRRGWSNHILIYWQGKKRRRKSNESRDEGNQEDTGRRGREKMNGVQTEEVTDSLVADVWDEKRENSLKSGIPLLLKWECKRKHWRRKEKEEKQRWGVEVVMIWWWEFRDVEIE